MNKVEVYNIDGKYCVPIECLPVEQYSSKQINITPKQKQEYTQEMIDTLGKETTLVIAMEELAELQQQVSKLYRGKGNLENLTEEIADVCICIDLIMKVSGITEEQLESWINKKMERNHLRIVNKEFK